MSVIHLYMEIFPNKAFRTIYYIMMAACAVYFLQVVAETFGYCHPAAYVWNKNIKGTCNSPARAWWAGSIFNMVLDINFFLLPLPMLWRLRVPLLHRFGVTIMFGLGVA